MESWVLLFLSLCLWLALKSFLSSKSRRSLPPGPPSFPIIGTPILLGKSLFNIEPILKHLTTQYGPILTLYIASRPAIFISDRTLAHEALIHKGAAFADRRPPLPHDRILSSNQHNISSAGYGPLWRVLRRNLTSEILHPTRIKQFANGREWVLSVLSDKLLAQAKTHNGVVSVIESFHDAMFGLLVLMCFGENLDEVVVREIEDVQRYLLLSFQKFVIFAFFPKITKLLFRKRWSKLLAIRRRQEDIFLPLIKRRRERKQGEEGCVNCYVDSLLELQLPGERGKELTDGEMVSLCSEFLAGGTDTTTTALQWIMANLVRRQDVQEKLVEEIEGTAGGDVEAVIKEEEMQKMPYLKAVIVILEGLRRHPPGHFVLPHAVTEEMTVGGYVIPKEASINFMVAEINHDEKAWEEPMEFRPERFLAGGEAEGVDITGSREIKMMPFGVGRRICPAMGLAMLHLEYFVVNLVRQFEWKAIQGEEVDISEKSEFTVVMKNPLRARISPRKGR